MNTIHQQQIKRRAPLFWNYALLYKKYLFKTKS